MDVRSPEEYAGTRLHMPDYPNEGALRGGHIPGAKSVPWARAINPDDGTFKTAAELADDLRRRTNGLDADQPTIAYCRIGERSSHTWFALTGTCSASRTSATTTAAGPSGATSVGVPIEK